MYLFILFFFFFFFLFFFLKHLFTLQQSKSANENSHQPDRFLIGVAGIIVASGAASVVFSVHGWPFDCLYRACAFGA